MSILPCDHCSTPFDTDKWEGYCESDMFCPECDERIAEEREAVREKAWHNLKGYSIYRYPDGLCVLELNGSQLSSSPSFEHMYDTAMQHSKGNPNWRATP